MCVGAAVETAAPTDGHPTVGAFDKENHTMEVPPIDEEPVDPRSEAEIELERVWQKNPLLALQDVGLIQEAKRNAERRERAAD